MPIPHYLIESFLAAADEGTFQLAADKLGLTQSTLSKQMQLLEEMLPQKVFAFSGRKKTLTSYGRTLYELVAPQFMQIDGLIQQAAMLHADVQNTSIRICGRGELLDMIAKNLKFKGQVSFLSVDSHQAMQNVLNRTCDIAIVHQVQDSSEIILKNFFSNRLRIIVPKKLLRDKNISKSDVMKKLQELPALLYKSEDEVVKNFLREYGIKFDELHVHRIYSNYVSILEMLKLGKGWAVIPSNMELNEDDFIVYQLSGKSQDVRQFYLCYRKELKSASWFKELINDFLGMKS
jgi:DNA-binding transcriptional LysR family regulator